MPVIMSQTKTTESTITTDPHETENYEDYIYIKTLTINETINSGESRKTISISEFSDESFDRYGIVACSIISWNPTEEERELGIKITCENIEGDKTLISVSGSESLSNTSFRELNASQPLLLNISVSDKNGGELHLSNQLGLQIQLSTYNRTKN